MHRCRVEPRGDDGGGGLVAFDVALQDVVEDVIRRQRVLVGLVRTQLGRRRLGEHGIWNHRPSLARVQPARHPVHHRLRHVRDDAEAARHVAVERAVAHGELRLVPRREQQGAALVRQRHQQVPANARLDVLLGDARLGARERRAERLRHRLHGRLDRERQRLDAEVRGQRKRVVDAAAAGIGRRHEDAEDVPGPERFRRIIAVATGSAPRVRPPTAS